MRDEIEQARYVVERVLDARERGSLLKQQAVLFRASHHSGPLEIELVRRNVPFVKFGGLKFLDAAHIKDILSLLRFVENPRDQIAGFRLLQIIPGVGPASAELVLNSMAAAPDPFLALAEYPSPPRASEDWPAFVTTILDLAAEKSGWPSEFQRAQLWYEPHADRIYEDATSRRADLVQLGQIAATFPSRERFLTELTLDPPDASSDHAGIPSRDEDYLILSTIYSAKGQEWKSVYVLNVVDGCIPSDLGTGTTAEIEEERRLLYVAMTRAKNDLHLIVPQRFFTHQQPSSGDRHVYASRSRFLPDSCFRYSRRGPGQWWMITRRANAEQGKGPNWISVLECAACGGRADPSKTLKSAEQVAHEQHEISDQPVWMSFGATAILSTAFGKI